MRKISIVGRPVTLQFVADPENILSAGDMPGLEELAPSVMKEPLISQGIMDIGLIPRSQESKGFFPLEGDEPGNNTVSTNDIERELREVKRELEGSKEEACIQNLKWS